MLIFDASTLILLSKIDLLEIFISNFDRRILIPEMIQTEVCIEGRDETPLLVRLIKEKKISVLKVKSNRLTRKFMEDFNIDIGEAEVLALALEEKASVVATDDRNAIRACKVLKIDFITAISVLIRALEKKLIDKEEAIIKLEKFGSVARYNRAIIEDARNKIAGGF